MSLSHRTVAANRARDTGTCECGARATHVVGNYAVGEPHRFCDRCYRRHLAELEVMRARVREFAAQLRREWRLGPRYVTVARVGIFRNSLGWLYLSFRKPVYDPQDSMATTKGNAR